MSALPPAVVFDLDGTLVDSLPDVCRALNVLMGELGRRDLSLEEVRGTVGHGAGYMMRRCLELTGGAQIDPAPLIQRYLVHYASDPVACTQVFPGAREALTALRSAGCVLGICSNKPSMMVDKVLRALDLDRLFAGITGGGDVARGKPHADHLFETLRRMGFDDHAAPRTVMVGDSATDVAAARNAGMPVVVVDFGYAERPVGELGADAVIGHFDQLLPALARFSGVPT